MLEQTLPKVLHGNLIWLSKPENEENKYCYFRKNFTVNIMPSQVEIRIAARSNFHLFINGRHIYYGESSLCSEKGYVHSIDITSAVEVGVNSISVSVHNSTHFAYHRFSHIKGGLWAELLFNNQVELATDSSWYGHAAECLFSANLKRSYRSGFTERLDFRKVNNFWLKRNADREECWISPDIIVPIAELRQNLSDHIICNIKSNEMEFKKVVGKGFTIRNSFSSGVEYSEIMNKAGVYMAESYFYADAPGPVDFEIYSDTPLKVYFNDKLILEDAVQKITNGQPNKVEDKLHEFLTPEQTLIISEGWNKLVVIQQLENSSYGFTMNIDADPIQFQLLRDPTADSLPGWQVTGPIKTPLAKTSGVMDLDYEDLTPFYSLQPIDCSAYQRTLLYRPIESGVEDEPLQLNNFTIKANNYITLDLGQIHYALPQLTLNGSKGDIVYITCASELKNGVATSFSQDRTRNVQETVLGDGDNHWIDFNPRGFRYIMILAKEIQGIVTIKDLSVKIIHRDYVQQGNFESSNKLINKIWLTSERTLDATVNFAIMDGADRANSQYIADSMIQSQVGFLLRGDYQSSLKALREFSAIQYETGEMPAMHPSSIHLHLIDFSLMFPEWVRQHYIYTGDKKVIIEFESTLRSLFRNLERYWLDDSRVIYLEEGNNELFIDQNMPESHGVVTSINALYCRALLNYSFLLNEIGITNEANKNEGHAHEVASIINNLCWDKNKKQFNDYWAGDESDINSSWQTSVLALYSGITTDEQSEVIINSLFQDSAPYCSYITAANYYTPYFMYFVLEALCNNGKQETAFKIIQYFWGGILAADSIKTWPEMYAPLRNPAKTLGSNCMGCSTSPIIYITREIAGITPVDPGYNKVYFTPQIDLIDNLSLQLPTLHGAINVEWVKNEDGEVEISLDANFPLTIIPIISTQEIITVNFHVSDAITIEE